MALSFTWTGDNTGIWSDPANWTDVTADPAPATDAPGAADEVALRGGPASLLLVNGPGEADTLTVANQVELNGTFNVGSIVQSGELAMLTGSVIAGSGGTFTGFVDEIGGGMMINGLAIDGGTLVVEPGAFMEIGSDGTADGSNALVIDANASITLRTGSLSVGRFLNNGTILATDSMSNPLSGTNAGLISGLSVDAVVNAGTIASGDNQFISLSNVTGAGEVDVSAGGTVAIGHGVTANVVFQDATGTLALDASGLPTDILTVQGFGGGDVITLGGAVRMAEFAANGWGDGTLTVTTDAGRFSIDIQGNYDSSEGVVFVQNGTATAGLGPTMPCFATGTLIWTRRGEIPVEALQPGDEVATLLPEGFRTVRWIGHRAIRPANHAKPAEVQPVCVRADAFGPNLPRRDLYLSPDHALFADSALVPVKYLLNGDSIAQVEVEVITYWHVELDRHDVLLAEGLPAESYLDTGDRASFANGGTVVALQPKFGALTWEAEGCAPLVVTGPVVDRLRALATAPHVADATAGPKRRAA